MVLVNKMSVDNLSDAELRSKLMEYGYPVGPVTQTTRKILAKKLKTLIETRGLAGTRHSLAARYSSDETDEDTASTVVKKKKSASNTRRQTLANPMPPPSSMIPAPSETKNLMKDPNVEIVDNIIPEPVGSSTFSNRTITSLQKKHTKIYNSANRSDGLETGSDSDIREENESSNYLQSRYLTNVGKLYGSKLHTEPTVGEEPSSKLYESKSRPVHTPKDNKYVEPPFKTYNTFISPTKEDTNVRDSRDLLSNYDTPFLSEFTRRLSSRATLDTPSTSHSSMNSSIIRDSPSVFPETYKKDLNHHFSSLKSLCSTLPAGSRKTIGKKFKSNSNKEDLRNNQNMISVFLVVVLALFFAILAIIYLGLGGKNETFPSLSMDSDIPLCFMGTPDLKAPGVNCVMKENVEKVLLLLKQLQPVLLKKAISVLCDNSSDIPYLTDSEIEDMLLKTKLDPLVVKEYLQNAQLLIIKNPQWGISLIDVSDGDKTSGEVLNSLDSIFSARINGKIGMIILNPDRPLQCHIKNKLFTIFSTLLIISLGILAVIGTQKLFVWYKRYQKSMERELFKLVSEIINIVEQHHQNVGLSSSGTTQDTFLAINHVRDNLILPKDRKRMSSLWEKAVKFLDENESRIRREVQQVAGEEFHVWRWLPNNTLNVSNAQSPSLNKKSKVWQGQAFETMEGSVNSLTCSPTPCLKIRHMFDPDAENDDNWEIKIQDAILEKCGEGVQILHIRVDRGSREGCVYMKCTSQRDAGKAYRALHGWWFDGHLVTVKYLRLERYYKRFPDAVQCTTALKPSNNKRLSMQAHYWQSPLESN
ncbi:PREDICTED: inner nuclear membrane protein Man1 isoform X2 [Polistes canadensis]|uniref:inner nuclear membrane protein Man1 isoform X2 n=1 Tax=Polistes canadensis TaxID=91411 RepID=UPI000719038A|nr:PREDICTED: inner nuclear membrane protein Man1 isoform X2 [Polistes canadensis]